MRSIMEENWAILDLGVPSQIHENHGLPGTTDTTVIMIFLKAISCDVTTRL